MLALEILKPDFDGSASTSLTTSVTSVFIRLPVGPRVLFVAEAPFAHLGTDFGGSESAFGNPYLGLEVRAPAGRVFGEIGLRLPTAPGNTASLVGSFTNPDHLEAFAEDVLPVTAMLNYRFRGPSGFVTRWRVGPTVWIDAGQSRSESELVLAYSGQVGYENRALSLLGGLSGQLVVTEDGNFGERSIHQMGGGLSVGSGSIRPGAQLRLPLDNDLTEVLDMVLGLSLAVALP